MVLVPIAYISQQQSHESYLNLCLNLLAEIACLNILIQMDINDMKFVKISSLFLLYSIYNELLDLICNSYAIN